MKKFQIISIAIVLVCILATVLLANGINIPNGTTKPILTKNGNCKIVITSNDASGVLTISMPNGKPSKDYIYNKGITTYENQTIYGNTVYGYNNATSGTISVDIFPME
jgi:hypothetical protein